MNPIKQVSREGTHTVFDFEPVASTKMFPFGKYEPGQPGAFEVNSIDQFQTEAPPRRYAYWNGRAFGPIASTPQAAVEQRFGRSTLGDTITAFSGLSEQPAADPYTVVNKTDKPVTISAPLGGEFRIATR